MIPLNRFMDWLEEPTPDVRWLERAAEKLRELEHREAGDANNAPASNSR